MQNTQDKNQKWWLVSVCATWLFLLTQIIPRQIADPDLWGRLSVPALFFQNNLVFPYTDPFSFTFLNQPWIDHEWLSGFVFYGAMLVFGEAGLSILKYALIGATVWLLFQLHRVVYQRSPLYALYGIILSSPVLAFGYYTTLRCQSFSFLFFTLSLFTLELVRLHQKPEVLRALVALLLVWSWLHGGFALGIILLGLYLIGHWVEQCKLSLTPYAKPLIFALLGIGFMNPYGPEYMEFIAQAISMTRLHVGEWAPLPLWNFEYIETKLLIVLTLFLLVRAKKITTPTLVLLFAILITLKAIRMQPFLVLAFIAYLPLLWEEAKLIRPSRFYNTFAKTGPVLIGIACAAVLGQLHTVQPLFSTVVPSQNDILAELNYPVGAINYLQASQLSGNLMTPFPVGEFTYWNLYPKFKISLDGRFEEVYSVEHYKNQYRFYKLPMPNAVDYAEQLNANFILANQGFANRELFENSPHWQIVYTDFSFVIFAHKNTLAHKPVIATPPSKNSYTIGDFFTAADRARFKSQS